MTVRVSTAVRNAMVDAARALLDAGSGAGKIRIYTGSQPAGGPGAAATGTLLVEIALSDPAYAAAASGAAAIDTDPALTGIASATGTAGWARLLDSDNTAVIDASVTATGGGGNITIDDGNGGADIETGASVTITSLPLSVAASA